MKRRWRKSASSGALASLLLLLLLVGPAARAHDGDHSGGPGWTLDPLLIVPLLLVLIVYLAGAARLARRAQHRRGRAGLFLIGWLVLGLAMISPLHEGGERSFTLHMIEHELIMLVATLLLAASHPAAELGWGLPKRATQSLTRSLSWLRSLWRWLTRPLPATLLQAVAMWAWHAPALFDRALDSRGWHIAQHASFIVTSLMFWTAMLKVRGGGYGIAAACLLFTAMIGGALGALMAFSQSPWYHGYAEMGLSGIGLDPVADQQLAGLLMWIPGGLVHFTAAFILFYRWLGSGDGTVTIRER